MIIAYYPYELIGASKAFVLWSDVIGSLCKLAAAIMIAGGVTISLLRYRLYDADMVISRSAGYAVLTLGLAGVWAGAERALDVVLEASLGHDAGAMSAGIAAALAALLVTPAHDRVMEWTERLFQKALSDLRRDLPQRVGDLRETASPDHIAQVVLSRVAPAGRGVRGALVLRHGKGFRSAATRHVTAQEVTAWLGADAAALVGERLERERGDKLFPLRLPLTAPAEEADETVGWLLLGPPPDGSFYGRDELEALREIEGPVARALQVARLRQAQETKQANALARMRRDAQRPARRLAEGFQRLNLRRAAFNGVWPGGLARLFLCQHYCQIRLCR